MPPDRSDLEYYQSMLRLYLKSVREDKNWTQQDLADYLECSKRTVENMEHPQEPSPPITNLLNFHRLAKLKDVGVESFVSILLGKKNEEAEEGGSFAREIAQDISKLGNKEQVTLKGALKTPSKANQAVDIFAKCVKSSPIRSQLAKKIFELSDKQARIVFQLIEALVEKK